MTGVVRFGEGALTIEDVWDIARRVREARLSDKDEVTSRIVRSSQVVEETIRRGSTIYGVTTGYGDSWRAITAAAWAAS